MWGISAHQTRLDRLIDRPRQAVGLRRCRWLDNDRLWYVVQDDKSTDPMGPSEPEIRGGTVRLY